MEFLLAMSIFSSAADISREKGRAWGPTRKDAAAEQRFASEPQEKKARGTPHFALEFDGINGFETIVSR